MKISEAFESVVALVIVVAAATFLFKHCSNENYRDKWLACECKDARSEELCKDVLRNKK